MTLGSLYLRSSPPYLKKWYYCLLTKMFLGCKHQYQWSCNFSVQQTFPLKIFFWVFSSFKLGNYGTFLDFISTNSQSWNLGITANVLRRAKPTDTYWNTNWNTDLYTWYIKLGRNRRLSIFFSCQGQIRGTCTAKY